MNDRSREEGCFLRWNRKRQDEGRAKTRFEHPDRPANLDRPARPGAERTASNPIGRNPHREIRARSDAVTDRCSSSNASRSNASRSALVPACAAAETSGSTESPRRIAANRRIASGSTVARARAPLAGDSDAHGITDVFGWRVGSVPSSARDARVIAASTTLTLRFPPQNAVHRSNNGDERPARISRRARRTCRARSRGSPEFGARRGIVPGAAIARVVASASPSVPCSMPSPKRMPGAARVDDPAAAEPGAREEPIAERLQKSRGTGVRAIDVGHPNLVVGSQKRPPRVVNRSALCGDVRPIELIRRAAAVRTATREGEIGADDDDGIAAGEDGELKRRCEHRSPDVEPADFNAQFVVPRPRFVV